MQYKIPQNVQIEDKIVGPLTMRQLVICGVGGGIAYVLYISLSKKYYAEVWFPPVAIISMLTLAIAFLKIKGIRFVKWFFLMLQAIINPRKRFWDKRESADFILYLSSSQKKEKKDDFSKGEKSFFEIQEAMESLNFPNILSKLETEKNAK